jgi:hypothetical protein
MIEKYLRSLLVVYQFQSLLWHLEGTKELSIEKDKAFVSQPEYIQVKQTQILFLMELWDTYFPKKVYIISYKLMSSSWFHVWILMAMFVEIIAAP